MVDNLWQSFDVEARRIDAGVGGAAGIAHHDSEFGEQGRKAMHRCAVIERVARHLGGAEFSWPVPPDRTWSFEFVGVGEQHDCTPPMAFAILDSEQTQWREALQ